jgi:hypothetical protein
VTIGLNVILIPMFGTIGAAFGTVISSTMVSSYGVWRLTRPESVIHFEGGMDRKPDFAVIRSLFRFGLPTGVQGIAMNIGGVFLLRFIGHSDQRGGAGGVRRRLHQLFSLIRGRRRPARRVGNDRGTESGAGKPERAAEGVQVASHIICGRGDCRAVFCCSQRIFWPAWHERSAALSIGGSCSAT